MYEQQGVETVRLLGLLGLVALLAGCAVAGASSGLTPPVGLTPEQAIARAAECSPPDPHRVGWGDVAIAFLPIVREAYAASLEADRMSRIDRDAYRACLKQRGWTER